MTDALFNAARAGDVDGLRALLDAHPEALNQRNQFGQSALLLACYHRQPEAVEFLLSRGAELTLHEACAAGRLERVQELIRQRGRLIDSYAKDGFTPLTLAAFFGHASIAEFLINQGANVSLATKNPMRVTPLHAAVARRQRAIVQLLLDHGANVNAAQQQGWTPLHGAAHNGDVDTVRLLLSQGADAEARSQGGQSALDLALMGGHGEVAALLESWVAAPPK